MEFWSEEFEEKLIELWKNMPVYMTKAFSDRVKKAVALENIYQEMNVAGWATPAKVKPLTFLLVPFECIAEIQ